MTPYQLTEAWGVGYLQSLITLILFIFGIPALIYQIFAPENIRPIIDKYMKKYLWIIYGIVVLFTLFALLLVWCLHPVNNYPCEQCPSLLASLFFTVALLTPLLCCIVIAKSLREKVISILKKRIKKRFKKDGSLLIDETIALITLGERSDAGYEKVIVLDAISGIIMAIMDFYQYSGNSLDDILRNFDKIVTGKDKPGNESDFLEAVVIVEEIIKRLPNKKTENDGDEIKVYYSLTEIGKKAAELQFSKVNQQISFIAAANSDALFEIGLVTFNAADYSAAINALSKLENLAMKPAEDKGQCISDFFGLLAHFWTGNKSSRRCAQKFLCSTENKFSPLEQYLDKVIEDHYNALRFDTADKLMTMKDDLLGKGI